MRHLIQTTFGPILMAFTLETSVPHPSLSLTAACRNNPGCIFENSDIWIDTTLKNDSTDTIGIPVEFLQRKGAYCTLIDNETHQKVTQRISRPPNALLEKITKIPPGGSITVTSVISAVTIRGFRPDMVDITVKLGIGIPITFSSGQDSFFFNGDTMLRILGKDKMER